MYRNFKRPAPTNSVTPRLLPPQAGRGGGALRFSQICYPHYFRKGGYRFASGHESRARGKYSDENKTPPRIVILRDFGVRAADDEESEAPQAISITML